MSPDIAMCPPGSKSAPGCKPLQQILLLTPTPEPQEQTGTFRKRRECEEQVLQPEDNSQPCPAGPAGFFCTAFNLSQVYHYDQY